MKHVVLLLGLVFALSGCQTALVFTGVIEAAGEDQALSVVSALDRDLKREGFTADALPHSRLPNGVARISSWWNPQGSFLVEAIAKKTEVSLRIVPQRGANDASRLVANRVRALLVDHFPSLKIQIIERPEADFLR